MSKDMVLSRQCRCCLILRTSNSLNFPASILANRTLHVLQRPTGILISLMLRSFKICLLTRSFRVSDVVVNVKMHGLQHIYFVNYDYVQNRFPNRLLYYSCLHLLSFNEDGVVFLDASSHLYKRVCPSVGPSVGWLFRNAFFFSLQKWRFFFMYVIREPQEHHSVSNVGLHLRKACLFVRPTILELSWKNRSKGRIY